MPEDAEIEEGMLDLLDGASELDVRRVVEDWLASHPEQAEVLHGQLSVDLALRARQRGEATNRALKQRILQSVAEVAAPAAMRKSIVDAVRAEATRSGVRRSRIREWWSWAVRTELRLPRWTMVAAVSALILASVLWFEKRRERRSARVSLAEASLVSGPVQAGASWRSLAAGEGIGRGETLVIGTNGALSLRLANEAWLQAGPGTKLSPRTETWWVVEQGLISVTASNRVPVVIETPHLTVSLRRGTVNLDCGGEFSWVWAAEGEAEIGEGTASRVLAEGKELTIRTSDPAGAGGAAEQRKRDFTAWPFHAESPWNISLGADADPIPVAAPGWPPVNLTNTVLIRPIIYCSLLDPRASFFAPGEAPRRVPYPADWMPKARKGEFVCAIYREDRLCCEMTEPMRRANGDVEARERNSTELAGPGMGWSWPRPRSIGGSALGGLIRRGELTFGIRHALAVGVNSRFLNGNRGLRGTVWPGAPIADELRETFGREGNLAIGALLVLPPETDIALLARGKRGPGYEIFRALQDYGAYVIQTAETDFQLIASADAGLPPDMDALVAQVLPHLRLVPNNHTGAVAGGGARRRGPAPDLAP